MWTCLSKNFSKIQFFLNLKISVILINSEREIGNL